MLSGKKRTSGITLVETGQKLWLPYGTDCLTFVDPYQSNKTRLTDQITCFDLTRLTNVNAASENHQACDDGYFMGSLAFDDGEEIKVFLSAHKKKILDNYAAKNRAIDTENDRPKTPSKYSRSFTTAEMSSLVETRGQNVISWLFAISGMYSLLRMCIPESSSTHTLLSLIACVLLFSLLHYEYRKPTISKTIGLWMRGGKERKAFLSADGQA